MLVGERRLRACKLAGLDRVRVEFVEREMSQADILAEQTVENMVRTPLSPVEQGRAYSRLMDLYGWTAKELSETIGVEATAVYRSLALLRLPDDVAERVDSGEIKATAAYEIAKLQIADDQRAVADAVVAGDLDHKATVAAVLVAGQGGTRAGGRARASRNCRPSGPSRPRPGSRSSLRPARVSTVPCSWPCWRKPPPRSGPRSSLATTWPRPDLVPLICSIITSRPRILTNSSQMVHATSRLLW